MQPPTSEHHRRRPPPAVAAAWRLGSAPEIVALRRSGFSGSEVYRVAGAEGRFVLKSFAAGTTPARAAWIHQLVRQLTAAGIAAVPAVVPATAGDTLVTDDTGTLWELSRFVAGRPDHTPDRRRAAAAMETLADLHRAAAAYDGGARGCHDLPAVARRRSQAAAVIEHPWTVRRAAAGRPRDPAAELLLGRWDTAIAVGRTHGAEAALAAVATCPSIPGSVQPVLRDIWSEHVLFDPAGHVAGIIDLHAAAVDTPATDLARLLGSWWPSGTSGEAAVAALDVYDRVRPLAALQRRLVPWLDAAGVVCGLDNWFRWSIEEGRNFPNSQAVLFRIDQLLDRLPGALATLCRLKPDG